MIYGRERTHAEWKTLFGDRSLPITFLDDEVFDRNLKRLKKRFEDARELSLHPALDLESMGSADLTWSAVQVWGQASPDFVAHRWTSARWLLENTSARCLLRMPLASSSNLGEWIDLLKKYSGRLFWVISSWESLREAKDWIERLKTEGLVLPIVLELPNHDLRDQLADEQKLGVAQGWSLKGFWRRKRGALQDRRLSWSWNRIRSGVFRLKYENSAAPDRFMHLAVQDWKDLLENSRSEIPRDFWWIEESAALLGSSEQDWVEGESLEPALFAASSILETLDNGAVLALHSTHLNGTPWSPWGLEKLKHSRENASELFLRLIRSHRGGQMEADSLKGGDPVVFRVSDLPEWSASFPYARIRPL